MAIGYQTVVIDLYTLCLISLDTRLLLVKLPYPKYMKHIQGKPRILLVITARCTLMGGIIFARLCRLSVLGQSEIYP